MEIALKTWNVYCELWCFFLLPYVKTKLYDTISKMLRLTSLRKETTPFHVTGLSWPEVQCTMGMLVELNHFFYDYFYNRHCRKLLISCTNLTISTIFSFLWSCHRQYIPRAFFVLSECGIPRVESVRSGGDHHVGDDVDGNQIGDCREITGHRGEHSLADLERDQIRPFFYDLAFNHITVLQKKVVCFWRWS